MVVYDVACLVKDKNMGNTISDAWHQHWPDWRKEPPYRNLEVDPNQGPTFDPMLGFPNGRKEREMHVTRDEMINAGVPNEWQDYCAHYYIKLAKCYERNSLYNKIVYGTCDHLKHEHMQCVFRDFEVRYKEFERQRRLRARQKRRIAKGLEPDPNDKNKEMM